MDTQAKVSSLDALDAFRSSLLIYLERARHILDDVQHDIQRTRAWLEQDRLPHWKKQIRTRSRELAQADQELLTARLSAQSEAIRDRRRTVERTRALLAEAEGAMERVRSWLRQYDRELDPHMRTTLALRQFLDLDLVKAVALLTDTGRVLAEYAERSRTPTPEARAAADPPVAEQPPKSEGAGS